MPSLAVGTVFNLSGQVVSRSDTSTATSASYKVTVTTADDLATKFSQWSGSVNTLNQAQQAITLTVVRTKSGVAKTTVYKGILAKQQFGQLVANASSVTQAQGIVTDDNGNSAYIAVVTNSAVCSGKQALQAQFHDSDEFSTVMGFTCRA